MWLSATVVRSDTLAPLIPSGGCDYNRKAHFRAPYGEAGAAMTTFGGVPPTTATPFLKGNAMPNPAQSYETLISDNATLVLIDHQADLMSGVRATYRNVRARNGYRGFVAAAIAAVGSSRFHHRRRAGADPGKCADRARRGHCGTRHADGRTAVLAMSCLQRRLGCERRVSAPRRTISLLSYQTGQNP